MGEKMLAGSRTTPRLARLASAAPIGALFAVFFATFVHLAIVWFIVPYPIAREPLRRKVASLTQSAKPWLIVAGDSRAQVHVRPDVLAAKLYWPAETVVNVGIPVCESSGVLAAYREFADRFASNPIMLLSVSPYSVNDGVTDERFLGDEVLGSVSLTERLRLAPVKRALLGTFLPEKAWWRLLTEDPDERAALPAANGFLGGLADTSADLAPDELARQVDELRRCWFGRPHLAGIRWRLLESDLRTLLDMGVQLVVLDSPVHPAVQKALADTEAAEAFRQFAAQLAELCARWEVPLLRYTPQDFADCTVDEIFFNVTHLNVNGATVLSQRIGTDLGRLIYQGRLVKPTAAER
ncbi:MAG: hypothetical protein KJ749_01275 [Planctomycetes bacterium]|nr:hypothetical protein [Planctomycetota bacterium]